MGVEYEYEDDAYMICPVRKATKEERRFLKWYKKKLEKKGFKVHYPATDTVQEDETHGYRICIDHCREISRARTVHVYWNRDSPGSHVDLGTSLLEHYRRGMEILLINRSTVGKIVEQQKKEGLNKSYEMVLLHLDSIAKSKTRIR
jgi:hypothetical protein